MLTLKSCVTLLSLSLITSAALADATCLKAVAKLTTTNSEYGHMAAYYLGNTGIGKNNSWIDGPYFGFALGAYPMLVGGCPGTGPSALTACNYETPATITRCDATPDGKGYNVSLSNDLLSASVTIPIGKAPVTGVSGSMTGKSFLDPSSGSSNNFVPVSQD